MGIHISEMPNYPKEHAAMQRSVCAVCFKKHKTLRSISDKVKTQIKDKCLTEFDSDEWSWLPTVICGGCYMRLAEVVRNPRFVFKFQFVKTFCFAQVCSSTCGLPQSGCPC